MKMNIFIIILVLCSFIKAQEQNSELISYEKLNTIEMIYQNQSFIIKTTEESIAYFNSLDRNTFVYMTTEEEKFLTQTEERINGKFIHIEPNVIYYVRIYFMPNSLTSNLIKYVYPVKLFEQNIEIKENLNYLYLQKDQTYTLDFKENNITKKLIKLSRKTLNTKIIINDDKELNDENIYYELEEDFQGELKLEIKENDAFIELLKGDEDFDTLYDISKSNYEIQNDTTIIIIEKTQKDFYLRLRSNEQFAFSFSYDFSDNETYFYNNMKPSLIPGKKDGEDFYEIKYFFYTPYKNISLSQIEFFTFIIKLEKKSEQKIILDYKQQSYIDPILDEKLDKNYCEKVIKYLSEIFDLYVFTDIAKNPPIIKGQENYHHRKIDIKQELANIKTEDRYFYEFYQEFMGLIAILKDLHLTIYGLTTPKLFPFIRYFIDLPFDFVIKQDKDQKYKLFIEINDYISKYEQETQQIIKNFVDVPLKTINDMDPFDYVQQFSKFQVTKNVHAQFTLTINSIISHFNLVRSPLNYSDFALNDYEFENNYILRLGYHIPAINLEDVELNNFYINYLKSKQKEIQSQYYKFPKEEEIQEKYLIYKGIKKENKEKEKEILFNNNNEEKIEWNITINGLEDKNSYLKCRVDEENQVNVVVQTTFLFDYYLGLLKTIQCAKLFHTNNYPIIIIESLNGGGSAQMYMTMHQLFNMRTVDRTYFSFRMSDISREQNEDVSMYRTNMKTCDYIYSFDNFTEVKDYYNYNGENIEHIRSEAMDLLPFYFRDILKQFREEYKDSKNLKKPTDIIIFTDSYSYSATCGLIKGFQNTGGAIIVGYFGNPKLNDTNLFDGSQSISSVEDIEELDVYDNLYDLGILVKQVTVGESFNDSIYGENPIPREYAFDPVDYKVDIYSKYSDNNYKDFITQGKKIHAKFNKENYCNSKNEKLLLHSDCTIEGKEYAHGGYKCHPDKNEWDTNNCQPYYCDIGYYYNQFYQKCMEECSFDDTQNYLIIDDVDKKTYEIDKNKITTFTILNEKNNQYYFYKSLEDVVEIFPKIGFIKSDTLILNKNKNAKNNFSFSLTKLVTDIQLLVLINSLTLENIQLLTMKLLMIMQLPEDHIFYGYSINNFDKNKVKFAKYQDSMNLEDILNGNDEYFNEYKNNDGILTLEKNIINIFYMNYAQPDQVQYYLAPKNTPSNINIVGTDTYFLYLQKDKTYELDFSENTVNRMIKLSRKTLKSEITIVDENVVLNSNNIYYEIKIEFKGKLKLKVKNDDAIIEFLFKLNSMSIMNFRENSNYNSNSNTLITIEKEYFSKLLSFKIKGGNDVSFNIFEGFSKSPYTYYKFKSTVKISPKEDMDFQFLIEDIQLYQDEVYCILFENLGKQMLSIKTSIEQDSKKDEKGDDLETWKVALIVIGSIIALFLIIFIIIYCLKKRKLSSEQIEDKMKNLTDMN